MNSSCVPHDKVSRNSCARVSTELTPTHPPVSTSAPLYVHILFPRVAINSRCLKGFKMNNRRSLYVNLNAKRNLVYGCKCLAYSCVHTSFPPPSNEVSDAHKFEKNQRDNSDLKRAAFNYFGKLIIQAASNQVEKNYQLKRSPTQVIFL